MTTITDGEAGSSVRTKLNASLAKTDWLTVNGAVNLDTIGTKAGYITVTQAVDLDAVEARVTALDQAFVDKGTWDASAGTFPGAGAALAGETWRVSVAGTVDSVAFVAGDEIRAIVDSASTTTFAANWFKTDNTDAVVSVAGLTGTISGAGLKTALGQWVTADYTDSSVTYGKIQLVSAYSILGNGTGSTGSVAPMTAGTNSVLRRITGDIGWGTLSTAHLDNNAVTNAKAAQMAQSTIKGRSTAGTGNPEDLTGTQATALLDVFTSAAKGLTPASGGGSTNFLRADGTWAVPAGGGGGGASPTAFFNGTGATLVKGTPVCLAAYDVGSSTPGMAAADADASGFMPVLGILGANCLNGAAAAPITSGGEITGLDTSAYTLNQVLYAGTSPGTMTGTRPTSGKIQPVAIVSRVDAVTGEIIVQLWEAGELFIENFTVAVSDETTNLTTGAAKLTFRMPFAFTLTGVRANVNTAPTGSTLNVDVNEAGVSIFSTVLTIDASEKTSVTAATAAAISDAALADDAEMTVDIDQVGSTVPGKGLKLTFYGFRV